MHGIGTLRYAVPSIHAMNRTGIYSTSIHLSRHFTTATVVPTRHQRKHLEDWLAENRTALLSLSNRTAHSGTEIGLLEQTLRFLSQQQVRDVTRGDDYFCRDLSRIASSCPSTRCRRKPCRSWLCETVW